MERLNTRTAANLEKIKSSNFEIYSEFARLRKEMTVEMRELRARNANLEGRNAEIAVENEELRVIQTLLMNLEPLQVFR